MSMAQTLTGQNSSDGMRCPRCGCPLPSQATFCGTCGERVTRSDATNRFLSTSDATKRYRFTTLVQRRPYVQLFLAKDLQRQRPIVIRDIDISSLDHAVRKQAIDALRQEYDLLRREHIAGVMPVVEMWIQRDHLYVAAGWPVVNGTSTTSEIHLYTLQDLLQSGIGLPDEAIVLAWGYRLAQALHALHLQHIAVGDLDPNTVAVNTVNYESLPTLMVSWLPASLRNLLPYSVNTNPQHFCAPEVLFNHVEPRSDVYSLGALLYLLLTGKAPDEATVRMQRPMRTPREMNSRLNPDTSDLVMHALAIESTERFRSAGMLAHALLQAYSALPNADPQLLGADITQFQQEPIADNPDEVTVSIVPLRSRLADLYLTSMRTATQEEQQQHVRISDAQTSLSAVADAATVSSSKDDFNALDVNHASEDVVPGHSRELMLLQSHELIGRDVSGQQQAEEGHYLENDDDEIDIHIGASPLQRMRTQLSGLLPILPRPRAADALSATQRKEKQAQSFLKRLQRFILGEQQHTTAAAALIETPMRVQPNQGYVIRIHLTGRDTPKPPPGTKAGAPLSGLSALVKGVGVHIEVRSALYQNYAYIVQRADVALPGNGYSAEVSIPMQPLANHETGRRERLHIFFTDELRRPLYEKPFVVEVFVSPLVQNGREGYNVLTIPL